MAVPVCACPLPLDVVVPAANAADAPINASTTQIAAIQRTRMPATLPGPGPLQSLLKLLVAQLRELISVDLPAHGESPASSFAPPDWVREVAELMDQLGLERAALVTWSCGTRPSGCVRRFSRCR